MVVILVDCNVLVDHFRKKDPRLAKHLVSLPIGICGVTRSESLAGVRTAQERVSVLATIDVFQQILTPESIWDRVGDNVAFLKSKGVNVPFQDVVLATVGIHHDLEVWARDQHYPLMQIHLPQLRLFQEPP